MSKIVVIDDEKDIVEELKSYFESEGHSVETSLDGREGLQVVQNNSPDLVVLDIHLPGMNGMEVLKEIKKTRPRLPVIMITGYHADEYKEQIDRFEACLFLKKPLGLDELGQAVSRFLAT